MIRSRWTKSRTSWKPRVSSIRTEAMWPSRSYPRRSRSSLAITSRKKSKSGILNERSISIGWGDLELILLLRKTLLSISLLGLSNISASTRRQIDSSKMQALTAQRPIQLWVLVPTTYFPMSTIDLLHRIEPTQLRSWPNDQRTYSELKICQALKTITQKLLAQWLVASHGQRRLKHLEQLKSGSQLSLC